MSHSINKKDDAELFQAVDLLINYCKRTGLENPDIDCAISINDGDQVYQLKFERVDCELSNEIDNQS
jgi:hypothetical protein